MIKYMVLDFETYSEVDLKKAGAFEYSMHPTTEILCIGFQIGTRKELKTAPTRLATPIDSEFDAFLEALINPDIKLVAHNALFEQLITQNVLTRYKYLAKIPLSRWICTASLAASKGLPRSLSGAGQALGSENEKDLEGHKIMLKLCKPRKPSKTDPGNRWNDPDDYAALYSYCKADIKAETELFLKLPELHPKEREFWLLDQKMNLRGFMVDRKMVKNAIFLSEKIGAGLATKISEITQGELYSIKQVAKTKDFLKENGCILDNLQAPTVENALINMELTPTARQILNIRRMAGRSSTAKYTAFEMRSRHDGRARDNTLFYGAHTGRQSGNGIQPQNLFKRVIPQSEVLKHVKALRHGDYSTVLKAEQPLDVLASCIRSAIVSKKGYTLDVGDFSTIEVRVLFWLCGHKKGLDAIKNGVDLYLEMASLIYDTNLAKLTKKYNLGDDFAMKQRQLGKQTVLGAGFGIGVGGQKFHASAKQYSLDITLDTAKKAVRSYRELHKPVPHFWSVIEDAAVMALQNPTKTYKHGFLKWKMEGDWLTVTLPIGRKLSYFKPMMKRVRTKFGENLTLTYMGVDSVTKQYARQVTWGGKLTENVVQAVARDLLLEALLRLDKHGVSKPILAVHDEILAERKIGDSNEHQLFLDHMAMVPDWAIGLPIDVEGFCAPRYKK